MAADLNKKIFPFGGPMTRGRLSIVTLTLGRFVTIGWQLKHPNNKIRGGVGGGRIFPEATGNVDDSKSSPPWQRDENGKRKQSQHNPAVS